MRSLREGKGGEHAQGKGFGSGDRFVAAPSVLHDAGELDDLGNPAPVVFRFGLNRELQVRFVRPATEAKHFPGVGGYADTAVRSVTGAVWPTVKSFLPQTSRPRASQIGRSLKLEG